jgi:hypothetical protein
MSPNTGWAQNTGDSQEIKIGNKWRKRAVECQRFYRDESYAASLVTRDCAASRDCDPTIFISCQS